MANKKIARIPLNRDKVMAILKEQGLSLRKLDGDPDFDWSEKSIRRAFKVGTSFRLLNDLAKRLNVTTKELSGKEITMENEERNVTLIITFEGLSEEDANMMIEALPELEASIKEVAPEAVITIGRGLPLDGDTEVSK